MAGCLDVLHQTIFQQFNKTVQKKRYICISEMDPVTVRHISACIYHLVNRHLWQTQSHKKEISSMNVLSPQHLFPEQ